MEVSNGVIEWVTLKSEKEIPSIIMPDLVIEETKILGHKQNELGDEQEDEE